MLILESMVCIIWHSQLTCRLHAPFHVLSHAAMKPVEVQEKLALTKLRDRQWYVQPSCATSGDGLYEGLTWLTSNHKSK